MLEAFRIAAVHKATEWLGFISSIIELKKIIELIHFFSASLLINFVFGRYSPNPQKNFLLYSTSGLLILPLNTHNLTEFDPMSITAIESFLLSILYCIYLTDD